MFGAFDVECLQVRHGHNHHSNLQNTEQNSPHGSIPDKKRGNPVMVKSQNRIVRRGSKVADAVPVVLGERIYDLFEKSPEIATLRVKNDFTGFIRQRVKPAHRLEFFNKRTEYDLPPLISRRVVFLFKTGCGSAFDPRFYSWTRRHQYAAPNLKFCSSKFSR